MGTWEHRHALWHCVFPMIFGIIFLHQAAFPENNNSIKDLSYFIEEREVFFKDFIVQNDIPYKLYRQFVSLNSVNRIIADSSERDVLWFGAEGGFIRHNRKTGFRERFSPENDYPPLNIVDMADDITFVYIIDNSNTLYTFNKKTLELSVFKVFEGFNLRRVLSNENTLFVAARRGDAFPPLLSGGNASHYEIEGDKLDFFKYDKFTREWMHSHDLFNLSKSSEFVLSMQIDDKSLWIATEKNRVFRYLYQKNEILRMDENILKEAGLWNKNDIVTGISRRGYGQPSLHKNKNSMIIHFPFYYYCFYDTKEEKTKGCERINLYNESPCIEAFHDNEFWTVYSKADKVVCYNLSNKNRKEWHKNVNCAANDFYVDEGGFWTDAGWHAIYRFTASSAKWEKISDGLTSNNPVVVLDGNRIWFYEYLSEFISYYDDSKRKLFSLNWYTDVPKSVNQACIYRVMPEGDITWFVQCDALVKYYKSENKKKYFPTPHLQKLPYQLRDTQISMDPDTLWILLEQGILKFDKQAGQFTWVVLPGKCTGCSIQKNSKESLWIVDRNRILKMNKTTHAFEEYSKYNALPSDRAINITSDKSTLYINTASQVDSQDFTGKYLYTGGLTKYDEGNGVWEKIRLPDELLGNIKDKFPLKEYQNGTLQFSGDVPQSTVNICSANPDFHILVANSVLGIISDASFLYVATGCGIGILNKENQKWEYTLLWKLMDNRMHLFDDYMNFSSGGITSRIFEKGKYLAIRASNLLLFMDRETRETLYFNPSSRTVARYSPSDKRIERYIFTNSDFGFDFYSIKDMFVLNDTLLMVTTEGKLIAFSEKEQKLIRLHFKENSLSSISQFHINNDFLVITGNGISLYKSFKSP